MRVDNIIENLGDDTWPNRFAFSICVQPYLLHAAGASEEQHESHCRDSWHGQHASNSYCHCRRRTK